MDRPEQDKAGAAVMERPKGKSKNNNGHRNGASGADDRTQPRTGQSPKYARRRFFRSPARDLDWASGKIADTFNEIAATNQQMSRRTKTSWAGGWKRRQDPRTYYGFSRRAAPGVRWKSRSTR